MAELVEENAKVYIEARQLYGGHLPDGVDALGRPIGNVKGRPGRVKLLAGTDALRAATRFRCSCGTTVLVADVTFREVLAEGIAILLSDQVQEAVFVLSGADLSPEVGRFVLADTPK